MAKATSTDGTLTKAVEDIENKIANATDLNKLLNNNDFVKNLKKLPQTKQFEIFQKYKEQFAEVSKDPKAAATKWIDSLKKYMPNLDAVQNALTSGMTQGQQFLDNVRSSLQ